MMEFVRKPEGAAHASPLFRTTDDSECSLLLNAPRHQPHTHQGEAEKQCRRSAIWHGVGRCASVQQRRRIAGSVGPWARLPNVETKSISCGWRKSIGERAFGWWRTRDYLARARPVLT